MFWFSAAQLVCPLGSCCMERSVVLPAFELMGAAYNAAVQQLWSCCWPSLGSQCYPHAALGKNYVLVAWTSCLAWFSRLQVSPFAKNFHQYIYIYTFLSTFESESKRDGFSTPLQFQLKYRHFISMFYKTLKH
jgi:hypothetical protein